MEYGEFLQLNRRTKQAGTVVIHFCTKRSGSNAIANFVCNTYPAPKKIIHGDICCFDRGLEDNKKYIYEPSILHKNDYVEKVNLTLIRFEYIPLDKIDFNFNNYFKVLDLFTGEYGKLIILLSLRDPFNTVASIMKSKKIGKSFNRNKPEKRIRKRKKVMEIWKSYAREMLGYTNYVSCDKIFINYNKWFIDRSYREELAGKFGGESSESSYSVVTPDGWGSSFSSLDIKDAKKMPLFERWKEFENNENYREIFKDKELHELSRALFGEIEGTEELLDG